MEATYNVKGQQMKELKAVEMLQEIAIRLDPFDNKIELALLDGVFAELKELTQEKSCEGCEHSKDMAAHFKVVICTCDDDDMPFEDGTISLKVGKKFYCKHYTPKSKE